MIEEKVKAVIREVENFPKPGISFKDITPILKDAALCGEIVNRFAEQLKDTPFDVICAIESRGFLFGMLLAQHFKVPFVPIRKEGKLPYHKISYIYDLEYGSSTVELHRDAIESGARVLIHDDLLATGGTVKAASELVKQLGGKISGFAFLVELSFLAGREQLKDYSCPVHSIVHYQ